MMFRAAALLVSAAGTVAPWPAPHPIADTSRSCFTAADNKRLQFEVVQQAPPPNPRARTYSFYPLTGVATMRLGTLANTTAGMDAWYFQWANRSNVPVRTPSGREVVRKPNFQPGLAGARRQRTPFSGVAQANGCTLAQTATVLGLPQRATFYAETSRVKLVEETALPDGEGMAAEDTCVLPAGRLAPRAGVLLDYETHDGRTGEETERFLREFNNLVHGAGRKTLLMVDPFDAPSQRFNGISPGNAAQVAAMFDRTAIMLWSRNRQASIAQSYAAQKALLAGGGKFDSGRMLINFELAGTTLEDAEFVRRTILADRLAGVMFWRNRALQGGSCDSEVNRRIATVVFGTRPDGANDNNGRAGE